MRSLIGDLILAYGLTTHIFAMKGLCMDLAALAQDGASAVVAVMVTDAWGQIRTRLAGLLGGGDGQREQESIQQLENARASLMGSTADGRVAVEAELRGQLRERLRLDPLFAAEFAILAEELHRSAAQPSSGAIHQHGVASRGGTVIQAGRDVNGIGTR